MGCPHPQTSLSDQIYKDENAGPDSTVAKRSKSPNISRKLFSEDKIYQKEGFMSEKIYLDEKYCKNEDLYPVTEEDMKTHRYHQRIGALLTYHSANQMKFHKGTAFLISSDLLVTSAHNLYEKKTDSQIVLSRFYPGLNGNVHEFYQHEAFFYPDQFETLGSTDYDYALVKLKKPVPFGDQFRLTLAINFNNKDLDLAIFGYPGNNNYEVNKDGSIKKGFQSGLERKGFKDIEENILAYEISTTSGQSGCPIIVGKNKDLVVGVHKGGAKEDYNEYNIARYVNLDMVIRLQIWRQACGGQKFNVVDMSTSKPFDLSSPMFQQIMRMFKQEQRNKIRLKKVFEGQIMTKQIELQNLQQKFVKFGGSSSFDVLKLAKQNQKMQNQLKQSKSTLKKITENMNEMKKSQETLQKELSAKQRELDIKQKQIEKMSHGLKGEVQLKQELQTAINRIQAIKKQLMTKELQISNKQAQINSILAEQQSLRQELLKKQDKNSILQHAFVLKWDLNSEFAEHFDVENKKVRHKMTDGFYQLTSQNPLPKLKVSIINFRLEKYGDDKEIGLGIVTKSRKSAQSSFLRKGATVYWTYPRGLTKDRPQPFGKILRDEQIEEGENEKLFLAQGSTLQMKVDLINWAVTFINKVNGKGEYHNFPLSSIFQKEEVYVTCMMTKRLDCIDVL